MSLLGDITLFCVRNELQTYKYVIDTIIIHKCNELEQQKALEYVVGHCNTILNGRYKETHEKRHKYK
jgi:hypothetical protein